MSRTSQQIVVTKSIRRVLFRQFGHQFLEIVVVLFAPMSIAADKIDQAMFE
jgi:hypothetical protein